MGRAVRACTFCPRQAKIFVGGGAVGGVLRPSHVIRELLRRRPSEPHPIETLNVPAGAFKRLPSRIAEGLRLELSTLTLHCRGKWCCDEMCLPTPDGKPRFQITPCVHSHLNVLSGCIPGLRRTRRCDLSGTRSTAPRIPDDSRDAVLGSERN